MEKNNSLRIEFKNIRDNLSQESKQQYSYMVSQNLIALLNSEFKGANIFLGFYPLENEIDLRPFYDYLLKKTSIYIFRFLTLQIKVLCFIKLMI